MLELWKRIKQDSGAAYWLLFYTALFIWVSWLLIAQCINNLIVLNIVVYLLWMLVSIGQIVINWRKLVWIEVPEPQIVSDRNPSEQERSSLALLAVKPRLKAKS